MPLVLGDPAGILVLTTYLYKLTNLLGTPSYHLMAVVAVAIIAVTLPLVYLQRHLLRYAGRYVSLWGTGALDLIAALSVINVLLIGVGLAVALRLGVRLHA